MEIFTDKFKFSDEEAIAISHQTPVKQSFWYLMSQRRADITSIQIMQHLSNIPLIDSSLRNSHWDLNTPFILLSYCFFFKAFNLVDNASLVFFARFSLQQQSNCPLPVYTQTFAEMKRSVKRSSDDINCAIKKYGFSWLEEETPPFTFWFGLYHVVYLTDVCWPIRGTTW